MIERMSMGVVLQCYFLIIVTIGTLTTSASSRLQPFLDLEATYTAAAPLHTIAVGKSGSGYYPTIQAAIDSVPQNNNQWICIFIKEGVYREKVVIPPSKPFIFLRGEGMMRTQIVADGHYNIKDATFTSSADNVVAMNIGFVNSYNYPAAGNTRPRAPAVAAMIEGDKSAFYECGFFGLQDTLWDTWGRHYYRDCTFVGAVDFIFGEGLSLFEQCTLTIAPLPAGIDGYITAQGKSRANERSGFVFKNCNVNGAGTTYLGRAWGPYAMVIFYQTTFSDNVIPAGWFAWHYPGHERQFNFGEAGNQGHGLNIGGRVRWAKKLSTRTAAQYASLQFIDAQTWLYAQPRPST